MPEQRVRAEFEPKTLSEIADRMYEQYNNSAIQIAGQVEFMRRQTLAQQNAAKAAMETASYTKQNARYMLWSVIAIAVTSGLNAFFAFLIWYAPNSK